ncbi:MAG: hypothetical protein QG602_3783 [Verrucomicrobiota bacterium]|nr:hypothetical protein [Verrucomicrobiota bacterium]
MKIQLPFDLLPHLEGTSIATCFGLKNQRPTDHTVVDLKTREVHDLLVLLRALEADLHARCQKWQRLASKSPLGFTKRPRVELNRQAVHRAAQQIEDALQAAGKAKAYQPSSEVTEPGFRR